MGSSLVKYGPTHPGWCCLLADDDELIVDQINMNPPTLGGAGDDDEHSYWHDNDELYEIYGPLSLVKHGHTSLGGIGFSE